MFYLPGIFEKFYWENLEKIREVEKAAEILSIVWWRLILEVFLESQKYSRTENHELSKISENFIENVFIRIFTFI